MERNVVLPLAIPWRILAAAEEEAVAPCAYLQLEEAVTVPALEIPVQSASLRNCGNFFRYARCSFISLNKSSVNGTGSRRFGSFFGGITCSVSGFYATPSFSLG